MATVFMLLLVRFAIIAAVVAVIAISLFAVALHLKRRGKWESARNQIGPTVTRVADLYARRSPPNGRGSWKTRALTSAARRLNDEGEQK
ncbi:hypothetical protein QMK17_18650 [Rhodococcus sp. G-MC3]|uniref:hypothetical protein n=1 Tax=Rhodococcus sp. G-MC3 TaxID=3046209 RepID=UPI0024B9CA11|nr:hypothetical protein [Rhodococcus sp. G-MC3]MDJ0395349.1 hypothetical protein [Rhodococcus sp. G-MC3]